MEKVKVTICQGTTCFVMGGSALQELETALPARYKNSVEVQMQNCLGICVNNEFTKAPYVYVNNHLVSEATAEKVMVAVKEALEAKGV